MCHLAKQIKVFLVEKKKKNREREKDCQFRVSPAAIVLKDQ